MGVMADFIDAVDAYQRAKKSRDDAWTPTSDADLDELEKNAYAAFQRLLGRSDDPLSNR